MDEGKRMNLFSILWVVQRNFHKTFNKKYEMMNRASTMVYINANMPMAFAQYAQFVIHSHAVLDVVESIEKGKIDAE